MPKISKQPKSKKPKASKPKPKTGNRKAMKLTARPKISIPMGGTALAQRIAAAICLPGTCPNLRVKSSLFDSVPSAVDSLHSLYTIKQPTNLQTYPSMPIGNTFAALFKDPLRSSIVFTPNPNTAGTPVTYSYVASFRNGTNTNAFYTPASTNSTGVTQSLEPLYFISTGVWSPHGNRLYPGLAGNGYYYVWVDYTATVTIVQSSADTSAELICAYYSGKDEILPTLKFSSTTVTYTQALTTGGYVRFAYLSNNVSPTTTNLTVTVISNGDVFAHLALPNVENHYNQLTSVRVNAASIMVSPIAAPINLNGVLAGGFIENGKPWYDFTQSTAVLGLPQGYYDERVFAGGMYAFIKPSDSAEYNYYDYAKYDGTGLSSCAFNLDNPSRYLVILPSVDVQSNAALGLEFLLTYNWDIEYRTTDQWFETHRVSGTFYDTTNATEIVSNIPVFHDNPLHWKDITSAIAGGFNFVRKHASKLAKAFSIFMPHLAGPAHLASSLLNALPEL